MASTVEASSLSTITAIAAAPPAHPSFPIPSNHSLPLVLYIARVPGSRDVFLTPLKPREKVVSAEDVQSSLYYVHVNTEDDHQVLRAQRPSSANADASQLTSISENIIKRRPLLPGRKPAGSTTPPYPVNDPASGMHILSPPQQGPRISRKPVSSTQGPPPPPHLDLPEIPSRPLPTPPNEQPRRSSLHDENVRLLRRSEDSAENNPYFRKYEATAGAVDESDEIPDRTPGSLTLIRRDPASCEQWNVATIHDPPVHEVSSTALLNPSSARRTKKGGVPLYLDITNPGYVQFISTSRPDSRTSSSSTSSDPAPEGTFRRRLYMPGSRYADHGYGKHRKFRSVDLSTSRSGGESGDMRRTMRERTLSDFTASPTVDRRSKGYSFTSPWDGTCEFTTGATGKSLKCRHHLPPPAQDSVEVSELRFNLPTSTRNTPTPHSEKRSSYFSHHSLSDGSVTPAIMVDDEGKVDLSLGQEKAGGGFGGKQAKLGKLIIEPEGLKMLDLLVAANMGLWWRAYDRA